MSASALGFLGVTTGASLINRLFPPWAAELGLPGARLLGFDLEVGAPPDAVRAMVDRIARDQRLRGALVTTHKIAVFEHARNAFAELDADATALGEISAIIRRDDGLYGHALDPATSGRALDRLVPAAHWKEHPDAEALILGCGGAGLALAVTLACRGAGRRPRRITLSDVDPQRLEHGRRVLADPLADDRVRFVEVAGDNDPLIGSLGPGSLVVNATGLGKDRPGSPTSSRPPYPEDAVVWELNYRGARPFLETARAQATARRLRVADGWQYFLYGWAAAIAIVFEHPIDPPTMARLEALAAPLRDHG